MKIRALVNILLVAALMAMLTMYIGWIAVPVVAVIMSIGARELRLWPWQLGLGASLAWAVPLLMSAQSEAFPGLLRTLGGVFHLPSPAVLFLTLLLPFALGWSTGVVMAAVSGRMAK